MRRPLFLASIYAGAGLFALHAATSSSPAQAEVPQEVRSKFRELDRNGDGKLQPGEVPFGADAFARADRDKDGTLSAVEAYRYHLVEQAKKKFSKPNKDQQRFLAADKDKNGTISRAEFPGPEALFKRMDKDGNGEVTHDEGLRFSVEEELAEVFAKFDADLSGTLSRAEMPEEAKPIFDVADANADGELSGKEAFAFVYETRKAALEALKREKAGGASPAGSTTQGKAPAGGGKLGVLGVLIASFDALDKNGDKKLSLAEFGGTRELFARFDADGDRSVDRAELQLRYAWAQRLGVRGKALKARLDKAGLGIEVAVLGKEIEGLFAAGRYKEVAQLVDRIELRLARLEQGKE